MSRCLITTLKGTVADNDLLKIGEVKIKVSSVDNPSDKTQGITVKFNKKVTLSIVGNGYFTDKSLEKNKGKTLDVVANVNTFVYFSNGDYCISIPDKYSITTLSLFAEESGSDATIQNKALNIDNLEYSSDLEILRVSAENINGDFGSLKNLAKLTSVNMSNVDVYGDISAVKNMSSLASINMENTNVSGNIEAMTGLGKLTRFDVSGLNGNLQAIQNSSLLNLIIKRGTFYGDIAKLPATLIVLSLQYDNGSTLTWSDRPSTSNMFSIEGSPSIQNIDKMLQDMAACKVPTNGTPEVKIISATGTRTSASDDAVQTIKSRGYTVSINNVTL